MPTTILPQAPHDDATVSLPVGNLISLVSGLPDCGGYPGLYADFVATQLFAPELTALNGLVAPEGPHSVYELAGHSLLAEFTVSAVVITLSHPPSEAVAKIAELVTETGKVMQATIETARQAMAAA